MQKPAWQIREEARHVERFATDVQMFDGVPVWKSNGQVPPRDIVALWIAAGFPINEAETNRVRDVQTRAAIEAYRRNMANRTQEQIAEQRAEARAAHGPGVSLVDVFTGERYTT